MNEIPCNDIEEREKNFAKERRDAHVGQQHPSKKGSVPEIKIKQEGMSTVSRLL